MMILGTIKLWILTQIPESVHSTLVHVHSHLSLIKGHLTQFRMMQNKKTVKLERGVQPNFSYPPTAIYYTLISTLSICYK